MFNKTEKELLLKLFRVYAPSQKEDSVLSIIKEVLTAIGVKFQTNKFGNIYCLNHKNAPLLSAHTDCVGTPEAGHYVRFINFYKYGSDEILKGIGNIGGDDKCGVFLILLALINGLKVNAFFSVCEEIGGADGIRTILEDVENDKIFKSIPYCIVIDRKGNGDIISSSNGYCSKEFENEIAKIGEKYNYKPCLGGCSDMNSIKAYMNGCNISTGYYNPHTNQEYVSMNDLFNTWNYLQDIIQNLPRNIPLKKETVVVNNTQKTYNDNWWEMV